MNKSFLDFLFKNFHFTKLSTSFKTFPHILYYIITGNMSFPRVFSSQDTTPADVCNAGVCSFTSLCLRSAACILCHSKLVFITFSKLIIKCLFLKLYRFPSQDCFIDQSDLFWICNSKVTLMQI